MLILTRNSGQKLIIGDNIELMITSVRNNQVKIGIKAPREVKVVRQELISETVVESEIA